VTGAVRFFGPRSQPLPEIYFPYPRMTPDKLSFVMRTAGTPADLESGVRMAMREINPAQPIDEMATMDDYWARGMSHERSLTALAGIFTLLGTALAIVGIYALITYWVKCREREFGIRLALGARPGELLRGSVARAMLWVMPGIVAGTGLAFAARRMLESEVFEVKAWEPGLAAALGCALLVISALAGLTGARRAAVLDPARLLRWD
jgi:putative ABC transport system permease protein